MSNSHLFLKSGFPRAPLQNGLGRYIPQLLRVTLKYCKSSGQSRGMREFLEHDLVNFAEKNEGTVVYVKPKRFKAPTLTAEFLNGDQEFINCRDFSRDEINKWLNLLATQSGNKTNLRMRKYWHTEMPSIQGVWTPFTNRPVWQNTATYPNAFLSNSYQFEKTATAKVKEIFEKQKTIE